MGSECGVQYLQQEGVECFPLPMADLNSLACMWVSHDVNLLGHKDRWGSQDWLWVLEDFVPGEFEKNLKLGLVLMVACCFGMEDFLILVILIWFGGKSGASWEYIMKFKVVCLLILFWCLMEEFVWGEWEFGFCLVVEKEEDGKSMILF